MNNKDINALVEGRLSDEKKAEVVKWLLKNPKQQQRYHVLKARHVAKLLKEGGGKNKLDTKRKFADWYKYVGYAACVLLMVALAYTLVSPNEQLEAKYSQTILASTSIGENKTITLSDGTKVTLNANTTFSYPEKFSEESRDVSLQGEAFFDVAHNPEKPFKVATGNGMNIQVLGTVFNVKSYPEDQNVETTLVSGKVKVVEEQNQKTVVLAPSQRATYVKDADQRGCGVFIAAAGMAAHLAGAIKSNTTLPVIGVPLEGGILTGLDSLLSTLQMPKDSVILRFDLPNQKIIAQI